MREGVPCARMDRSVIVLPWWPIALKEMGVAEVQGEGDNPRIQEYLRSTTIGADLAKEDETPWCSAFVNWCVQQAGGVIGTKSAWARSWLMWGRAPRPLEDVPLGAILIFTRGEGGHVGFWAGPGENPRPDLIRVLGGNQGDRVQISQYPASRLLGVRVP